MAKTLARRTVVLKGFQMVEKKVPQTAEKMVVK